MTEWGAEIAVNGKPEWLQDNDIMQWRSREDGPDYWLGQNDSMGGDYREEDWSQKPYCLHYIRLRSDHPHYQKPVEFYDDKINSPSHYGAGSGIECIDAIRAALTPEEFRGYCKGNMLKYVWRERSKGGDESLQKAAKYAEFALEKTDA